MAEQTIALVTGANKGIGYEIAAGLGALGMTVGVGARDPRRGEEAVEKLRADGADAFFVPLDVSDDESVAAAAALVEERFGRLDVLVNNAGIAGSWPTAPSAVTPEAMREVLETNVIGVVRVTNAMLPLLGRSARPRIVNQSSHLSSLTLQSSPDSHFGDVDGIYTPSKTFLNAVTVQYAKELTGIKVNGSCPGYVATEFNDFQGRETPADGAKIAVELATLPDDGPTGGLFDSNGTVPW
ncbi:SDR family oxidoreductase [Nocardia sp. NRRL S-836]|uniref:SDR family oxidoreductase n=1 Tax=Nocardia sp. NRRL S-836 TaxID=1519492 RepID=UPI0006AD8C32|nr:SDR family oxidoreductase [Nocardia sp. NRRL S-836]KOV88919.1 dehydrogenase [Nocardia sp. NRRL S-836]